MAGIDLEMKRYYISQCYSGDRWRRRCQAMRPDQVIAVYQKFLNSGKIDRLKKTIGSKRNQKEEAKMHQVTIAEYMEAKNA